MSQSRSYGTVSPQEYVRARRRNQRNCCCCCMVLLAPIFFVLICYMFFESFHLLDGHGQSFEAPREWTRRKFAVGFDLTAGYTTAAISFANGTTTNVAKLDGGAEYNEVMARLSLASSEHPSPPYYGYGESEDRLRQWKRKLNKWRGFPASHDVGILAAMIEQLRSATNALLLSAGHDEMDLVFVTVPWLPALYMEDLLDACDYARLRLLTLPWYIYGQRSQIPVTEVSAAYAGNGRGLCRSYTNCTRCGEEGAAFEDLNVLVVLFTRTALTVHVSPLAGAMHMYAAPGIANFSVGLDKVDTGAYWNRLRSVVREGMHKYYRSRELGLVIVHGEGARDQTFRRVLEEEVQALNPSMPPTSDVDPVFAAARGAAEFAKRGPFVCLHPEDCFPDLTPRSK